MTSLRTYSAHLTVEKLRGIEHKRKMRRGSKGQGEKKMEEGDERRGRERV
jgi:hypothetical protein